MPRTLFPPTITGTSDLAELMLPVLSGPEFLGEDLAACHLAGGVYRAPSKKGKKHTKVLVQRGEHLHEIIVGKHSAGYFNEVLVVTTVTGHTYVAGTLPGPDDHLDQYLVFEVTL